jgi:hypothetical protein
MKLTLLLILAAVFAGVAIYIRNLSKNRAEEEFARQKAIELRKKHEKESLTPTEDMMWPVVGITVEGEEESDEPSMASIEYEAPEKIAS